MDEDITALEKFLIANPQLEELEALLEEFNIFETLGAVRQELRHSDFLAYLLDPHQNHGLGDTLVKRFLQLSVAGLDPLRLPVNAIELDTMNLNDIFVRRESESIDILLTSESNALVVVIENKVISGEHSGQLQRYYQIIQNQYPNYRKLFLFLTPEGEEPSDLNYLPVTYQVILDLLSNISESRRTTLGADVLTLIQHYLIILRRYILSGSRIEELCVEIYREHKRAIDLIIEYLPDQQKYVHDLLINLVEDTPGISPDISTKAAIRFIADPLDVHLLKQGQGWTSSGRMLIFEFENAKDRLRLKLIIGPGPTEFREKIFKLSVEDNPPLRSNYKQMGTKWHSVYWRSVLSAKDYEHSDLESVKQKILSFWNQFLENDLIKIVEIIGALPMIKESRLD